MHRRTVLAGLAGAAVSGRAAAPSRIRVGCQTRAYGSPLRDFKRFLSVLEDLAEAGYAGFETNYRSLEHGFDHPAEVRRELEARGVELIGLHVGAGLFDAAKLADELHLVRRVAEGVRGLDGKHLIVSGRKLPEGGDGRVESKALSFKARTLNELGVYCRQLGVRLSFHNHTHEVQNDADEIRRILAETDSELVSLLFDVGHVHNDEVDVAAFVREHASRISGLHVRDVKDGEEVLMGSGKVDFKALGGALKQADWSGWVIVEVNKRPDMPSRELVNHARNHLRRTMEI